MTRHTCASVTYHIGVEASLNSEKLFRKRQPLRMRNSVVKLGLCLFSYRTTHLTIKTVVEADWALMGCPKFLILFLNSYMFSILMNAWFSHQCLWFHKVHQTVNIGCFCSRHSLRGRKAPNQIISTLLFGKRKLFLI